MSYLQLEKLSNDIESVSIMMVEKSTLFVKRIVDLMICIPAILLLLPVFVVLAIRIRKDSKGSVLFCQKRVGLKGRSFTIYKFRTMVQDAEKLQRIKIDANHLDDFVFQTRNDPRVTRIGAFLRKTSLDELPQLFNVMMGNMSLVGPRPEIHEIADLYNQQQSQRLCVKPGITGLAQVMGRGELPLGETVAYDLEYIKNISLSYDLDILWKTFRVVIIHNGAF